MLMLFACADCFLIAKRYLQYYFSIHSGVDVPICTDFSGIDA